MKPTIDEVRTLLYPVQIKWYDIGIKLGLKGETLDKIKVADTDDGECLIKMIKVWLKSINPPPTWKALGHALGHINEARLAEKGD